MRDSSALTANDDFRTSSVLSVEDICMCLRYSGTFESLLHLQSLHFVWSSFSQTLATLETELFPGCEPSIPAAIDMPLVPRKLTTLMEPAWAIIALCLALRTMACIASEPGFQLSIWHCTERSLMQSTTRCCWSHRSQIFVAFPLNGLSFWAATAHTPLVLHKADSSGPVFPCTQVDAVDWIHAFALSFHGIRCVTIAWEDHVHSRSIVIKRRCSPIDLHFACLNL